MGELAFKARNDCPQQLPMRYIYNRDGWPGFTWDERVLGAQLREVHHQQGALFGHINTIDVVLSQEAALESMTQEAVNTSEIEGELLDVDEVRSSLAHRLGVDTLPPKTTDQRVKGIVDVLVDATQHYAQPLTADRLWTWHKLLFPPELFTSQRITVGRWRKGPVYIVSGPMGRPNVHFEAPKAEVVESEMNAFLKWFNRKSDIDPVLRSAIAHLWFVTIHAFDDGNGRIGRAIGEMALTQGERNSNRFYSMSAQILQERRNHYEMLKQTQRGTLDITPWLSWFLGCIGRSFERAGKELSTVQRNAQFWRKCPKESFNPRQLDMLTRLLNGFRGNLNAAKWQKIQKCDLETALSEIRDLVEKGILQETPDKYKHKNYELGALVGRARPLVPPQQTASALPRQPAPGNWGGLDR